MAKCIVAIVCLALLWATPASAQSTATITAKTCTLTLGPLNSTHAPDGTTSGWSVQFKRGATNHGVSDATAPYGPRAALVDAGAYQISAVWTKAGKPTVTENLGTATCAGGTVVPPSPPVPPAPPASTFSGECLHAWTFGSSGATLRDGVQVGGGLGQLYRCLNGSVVLVFGNDNQWWRWGTSWSPIGTADPGGVPQPWGTPAPAPAPAPTPVPTPTPTPPPVPPVVIGPITMPMQLSFSVGNVGEYATTARFMFRLTSGADVQTMDVGKPAIDAVGNAVVPVTVTLTRGQSYVPSVAACAAVCSAYVDGPAVAF